MITEFLYRKKTGIPFLSLIFVLSCLLVSVPTYLNAELYEVFGGERPLFYFWQPMTDFLEHGTSISFATLISLPLHISINLAVFLTFGIACEKLLGTKGYFLLLLTAFLVYRASSFFFNIWGNGASSISWALAPIAFYYCLRLYKKHKLRVLNDPMFYIFGFLFFMSWILITLFDILYGAQAINIFHLFATLTGVAFLMIFKKRITQRIEKITDGSEQTVKKPDALDKLIIGCSLLLPVFVIVILALWSSGGLTRHVSASKIISIFPQSSSVDVLNETGEILVKFSEPMEKEIMHSSVTINSGEDLPAVISELDWQDDRTLRIIFSRQFVKGETVSILLQGFRDVRQKKLYDKILLEYGFGG